MSKENSSRSPSPWNKTPWTRLHTTRSRRWMKATAILALFLGLFHLFSSVGAHRKALREKFTPTIYHRLQPQDHINLSNTSWRWGDQSRHNISTASYSREDTWAYRHYWKKLGSGAEGDTFVYNETVIKAYRTGQAPFRNCVPDVSPELRWPTEISASLLLGGTARAESMDNDTNFLPVIDYFLSPASSTETPKWHFLTPFLPAGNLPKLAHHLRASRHSYTPRELDTIFRPSLERLLDTLYQMHEQFDLCHDDIKLDNIFIAGTTSLNEAKKSPEGMKHWILADLGNVRESTHPYHSSILWSVLNHNLPDCRVNDVLRLLKIYMSFLGQSADDVHAFSRKFVEGGEPWGYCSGTFGMMYNLEKRSQRSKSKGLRCNLTHQPNRSGRQSTSAAGRSVTAIRGTDSSLAPRSP